METCGHPLLSMPMAQKKEGTGNLELSVSGKSNIEVVFEAVTAYSYAPVEAGLSRIYFYN